MQGSIKKEGTTWRFVLDLPRGSDGRRRQQKRRGFKTRRAAEEALQETMRRITDGNFIEPSKVTVGAYLCNHWLPIASRSLRPSTIDSYARNIRLHVLPTLDSVRLQALTTAMLNSLYDECQTKGLSAKTTRHIHTTLRKALGDAARWGLVGRNAAEFSNPPRVARHEMKTWTADETSQFLEFIAEDQLGIAFVLAATTGMRRGEVLGLRWRDIDFDKGRLSVGQTITSVNYAIHFGPPKTDRGRRSVPLDPRVVALLRQHRARQGKDRLMLGPDWQDLDLVMAKFDGTPIHPDTFSDTFDRRVRSSGLPRIRLHDLRHTYATLALSNGVPVKVVSDVLGHSSTAFTMDVYGHATPSMMEDMAKTIGGLMFRGETSKSQQGLGER